MQRKLSSLFKLLFGFVFVLCLSTKTDACSTSLYQVGTNSIARVLFGPRLDRNLFESELHRDSISSTSRSLESLLALLHKEFEDLRPEIEKLVNEGARLRPGLLLIKWTPSQRRRTRLIRLLREFGENQLNRPGLIRDAIDPFASATYEYGLRNWINARLRTLNQNLDGDFSELPTGVRSKFFWSARWGGLRLVSIGTVILISVDVYRGAQAGYAAEQTESMTTEINQINSSIQSSLERLKRNESP